MAEFRNREIVNPHLFRLPFRAQLPAAVFEIAHQFSLFGVNRDGRHFSAEISFHLAVEVFKLGIPVGMARPFVGLAVGLQTVLQFVE